MKRYFPLALFIGLVSILRANADPGPQEMPLDRVIPPETRARIRQNREAMQLKISAFDLRSLKNSEVDLRYRDTPIKTQHTPTCTAFASVAAMENLLNGKFELSESHAWSKYRKKSVYAAMRGLAKSGVVEEEWWPQETGSPRPGYRDQLWYRLMEFDYLEDDTIEALKALDEGHPVYVGLPTPQDMYLGKRVISADTKLRSTGHALAIVGYRLDASVAGGGYFLMKNSWGDHIGEGGYQWVPIGLCHRADMYCHMWSFKLVTPEQGALPPK